MTTKRFPVYRDLLNLSMLYMMLLSAFMVLATSIHIKILPAEFFGIGFVILCCYLMREFIKWLWVYVTLHLGMIGICLFLPLDSPGKIRLAIAAIVMSLLDMHNWINHEKSVPDMHPGLGVIFFLSLFFTSGRFEFGYSAAVYYMGVAFAVLLMVRSMIRNFYELSQTGQLDDDMPVREIFRNNALITAVIIVAVTLAMLFIRSDRLVLALNRIGYEVWMRLSNLLSRMFGVTDGEQFTRPLSSMDELMKELAQEDVDGGFFSLIMRLFESALILLCIAVILFCVCKASIFLCRALMGKREKRTRRYKTYKQKNEVRQSLREEAAKEHRRGLFRTPYEKVRDLYKKEMKKQKKAGADVRNTKTPEENRLIVLNANGADLAGATALYERIRYGDESKAVAKDVAALKSSLKSAGG